MFLMEPLAAASALDIALNYPQGKYSLKGYSWEYNLSGVPAFKLKPNSRVSVVVNGWEEPFVHLKLSSFHEAVRKAKIQLNSSRNNQK